MATRCRSITSHLCCWNMRASFLLPGVGPCSGSVGGGLRDAPGECSYPGFYSWLFLVVKVTGKGLGAHWSVGSSWLRHANEVRDGDRSVCVRVYQEEGLDVLDRPQRRVIPDSFPSRISTVSTVLSRRACLPVPCPVFLSVHNFGGVHQSLRSGSGVDALQGRVPSSLPGRLAGHSGVEDPFAAASGSGFPVVQGSRENCRLGEVRPPAVRLCPASGDAGGYVSRGGAPFGSSSGSGDFFSHISAAPSGHVAAGVGPHSFTGAFSSLRWLPHASSALVPRGSVVPHDGPPGRSDSSVTGVCGGGCWRLQEDRWVFGVPLLVPPSLSLHADVSVGLGSSPVKSDGWGCVVQGRGLGARPCAGNSGGFLSSSYASAPVVKSECCPAERQRHSCCISPASGRNSVSCPVSHGRRVSSLDQASFGLPDSQGYSREKHCFGDRAQSSRPDSSYRIVPFSKGVHGVLQGVWSSPSRPLCHSSQCQASSVRVSSSRPEGVEARHIPTPLGPSISLCLPSICLA